MVTREDELMDTVQELVSYISKMSYCKNLGDVPVVDIDKKLDDMLDKLDELSRNT